MYKTIIGICILAVQGLYLYGAEAADFVTIRPFYGVKYADIDSFPRGLLLDEGGNVLVVSRGHSQILSLTDVTDPDETIVTCIVDAPDLKLNHGITFHNGYLYASSPSHVYRWRYEVPGEPINTTEEIVVRNIPFGGSGNHNTRTLVVDAESRLYVSVGSELNVDLDSWRSKIRRFEIGPNVVIPDGGYEFQEAEVFADGVRNEVGLAFDKYGFLWGVENGPDLIGEINEENPAEELNRFSNDAIGQFYGYPYCISTDNWLNHTLGTQLVMPDFETDGIHSDAWCQNETNVVRPILSMPSHTAPLDITFYDGIGCDSVPGSFPCSFIGDAFVTFHAPGRAAVKHGFSVARLPFDKDTGLPTGQIINIIYEKDYNCRDYGDCFWAVSVIFNRLGHMVISTDYSHELFKLYYIDI